MLLSSPEPPGFNRTPRSNPVPHSAPRPRLRSRLAEVLCREKPEDIIQCPYPARSAERPQHGPDREQGSAVVEFTFLALLLMVPLVYFVITVGQIQGGSFAVVGAADQAAKVYVAQPDASTAQAAAERAVSLALSDFGHEPGRAKHDDKL